MTVLNAFSDIPSIDARKLPAAPVPRIVDKLGGRTQIPTADDKIDSPEFRNRFSDCVLELLRLSHIGLCGYACLPCNSRELIGTFRESLEADG
jgi:hypothetical protein